MKIGGERFIPGQPLTERQYQVATMGMQMGNKYNDEVLRSYAMYEQNNSSETEVIIINKNTTTPVLSGGNSGGTVVNNQVIVDDGQSFERYQGY